MRMRTRLRGDPKCLLMVSAIQGHLNQIKGTKIITFFRGFVMY